MHSLCRKALVLLLLSAAGCTQNNEDQPKPYQLINGRDNGVTLIRQPIYRVKVPPGWLRKDPAPNESIMDSTKPLAEFWIVEGADQIRISIHNFPVDAVEQRVAPAAQVARWKKQFETLAVIDTKTEPQSFSGYSGLLFEGTGLIAGKKNTVLGWSMQLAPEHFRNLGEDSQKKADFTIKASGPPALMANYKPAIASFANSFELIEEIPARP